MSDSKPDAPKAAETNANEGAATRPPEMRAVVLTGFGGLKAVKVMKRPEPVAGEGEVLIRVKACGLNFLDLMARQGAIDNPPKTPCIMGFECAGTIEAVGEGVTNFKIGDTVAALTEYQAWAELVNAPVTSVYALPQGMSPQEAASLLMNYVVAYCLVFDIGNVQPGQKVLLHSAGGSVGLAVASLCKTVSDVTLIGTASKHKHESIAENFSNLFDHSEDYVQETKKLYPEGVDLVLDCVCGEDVNKGYSLLKPLGRYVLYGTSSIVSGETKSFFSFAKSWWQVDKVSPIKLFDENKILAGFHLRHLLFQQGCHEYIRGVVTKVFKLWQDNKIKSLTDSGWAFEDVAEAMQKMHDRKNVGKITLLPDKAPKPQVKAGSKDKSITSGESTDVENPKDEQTPPP